MAMIRFPQKQATGIRGLIASTVFYHGWCAVGIVVMPILGMIVKPIMRRFYDEDGNLYV